MVVAEPAKESTRTNRDGEEYTQLDHHVAEGIIEDVDHSSTEDDNKTLTPRNLQEGWLEATDPSSGKSSYYSKVTGANVWKHPVEEHQKIMKLLTTLYQIQMLHWR